MPALAHPKICLIIGEPVAHSLSPCMHNAGYQALGIANEFCFSSAQISISQLPKALEALKLLKIRGAACTMPLKEALVPLIDWLDPHAQAIGAVNTIIFEEDILKGFNTDWLGITTPLKQKRELKGKRGLILGAGGAARAAIYALKSLGMVVSVSNRSQEKAQDLAQHFSIASIDWDKRQLDNDWDVIINTTSLGMAPQNDLSPLADFKFSDQHIVFETIYTPRLTALLQSAQKHSAQTFQGIDMLLYQGLAQFEIFTGRPAPLEAMKAALEAALS
jgi:shikimate dehydrogenase